MSMKLSKKHKAEIFAKTSGRCSYCGINLLPGEEWTIDHAIPRQQNGTDALCNLFPACKKCNSSKRDRTVEEYAIYLTDRIRYRIFDVIGDIARIPSIRWSADAAADKNRTRILIDKLDIIEEAIYDGEVSFCADALFVSAGLRTHKPEIETPTAINKG